MIEMVLIVGVIVSLIAYAFWLADSSTSGFAQSGNLTDQSALLFEENLADDSALGNQFLAQIQQEIEVNLFPRPTDSVLKRHYDSLVAAKLGERLAQMPS